MPIADRERGCYPLSNECGGQRQSRNAMTSIGSENANANSASLWRLAGATYRIMGVRRRLQLMSTIVFMMLGAIAELVTVGAVLPLLALAADPEYLENVPAAQSIL